MDKMVGKKGIKIDKIVEKGGEIVGMQKKFEKMK